MEGWRGSCRVDGRDDCKCEKFMEGSTGMGGLVSE